MTTHSNIDHDYLRSQFNPDGSAIRNIQIKLLSLLRELDAICKANNITYTLSSGSCLGAIRHNGFIPWDDDLDVEMSLKDYRKLRSIINNDSSSPFVVQDRSNDPGYYFQFGKLKRKDGTLRQNEPDGFDRDYKWHGEFIDLFIMTPSNSRFLHRAGYQFTKLAALRRFIRRPWLQKVYGFVVGGTVYNLILPLLDAIGRISAGQRLRHKMGGTFHAPRYANELWPATTHQFEDIQIPVPGNADAYLRHIFGNYMQLPDLTKLPRHFS